MSEILFSRRTPEGRFFRVRVRVEPDIDQIFELLYNESLDQWEVEM